MKQILRDEERLYSLYEDDDGHLHLDVVCGGIGMFEIRIRLSAEEVRRFGSDGKTFLDSLALDVSRNTKKYEERAESR